MTEYEADLPVLVAFPPEVVPCLAGAFETAGWRQLHVAETEKYAHITYFLNGGREAPFEGEDRVLVPSPKVATYDLQPEMSAPGGSPITAHSLSPVPIVVAGRAVEGRSLANGVLADVAPTLLELAGLPAWPGITGRSLLRG